MQEIIKAVEVQEKVTLDSLGAYPIYLAEKGNKQFILSELNGVYFWNHFYLRKCVRTKYNTFRLAIQSRFDKGYKVYVLRSKKEFQEMIKPQGKAWYSK